MAPPSTSNFSPSELSYLHTSLSLHPPIRPDARSPTTFRPLVAETDFLPSANGSARLCFADGTEAIVGVKAEVEKVAGTGRHAGNDNVHVERVEDEVMNEEAEDRKDEIGNGKGEDAWVEVTIDMPGQRDDDATTIFLAQMIQEGLVADGTLPNRLSINPRYHWRLYVDILLLSPPTTYPLPLLSQTTHLALQTTHLPALISTGPEDPLFNNDWDAATPLYPSSSSSKPTHTKPPITLLPISINSNIFFDPSREELAVADAVVAVTIAIAASPSPSPSSSKSLKLLAVRTIDPPSRVSGATAEGGEEEGVWRPSRGGVGRDVLGRMVGMCLERGGVGEEVLRGLEGFMG